MAAMVFSLPFCTKWGTLLVRRALIPHDFVCDQFCHVSRVHASLPLGIGSLWDYSNVADPSPNCDYVGINANREYKAVSGCSSAAVERKGGSGTACVHWDEQCMGNELMTGYLGSNAASPLSRITVGSLQDLGYEVDYSQADTFVRADLNASCICPGRRLRSPERSLADMKHGEAFLVGRSRSIHRRRLSTDAEAMAIEAGLEYLTSNAQNTTQTEQTVGAKYVADEVVSVLVIERGEIYGVVVRRPE
jgi:Leishmanolysin